MIDTVTHRVDNLDRGRTTTGMVCACLVASVLSGNYKDLESEEARSPFEYLEGVSEEEAYLNGKNSLQCKPMVAMRSVLPRG